MIARAFLLNLLLLTQLDPIVLPKPLLEFVKFRAMQQHPSGGEIRYSADHAILDGNNTFWLVYVDGPGTCSRGDCELYIFRLLPDDRIQLYGDVLVESFSVRLLQTSSHGLNDLAVTAPSTEGRPHEVILRFNGTQYPSKAALEPPVQKAAGQRLFLGAVDDYLLH